MASNSTNKMYNLLYVAMHLSSEQPSLENFRGNSAFSSTIDLNNRIKKYREYNFDLTLIQMFYRLYSIARLSSIYDSRF